MHDLEKSPKILRQLRRSLLIILNFEQMQL